MKPYSILKKVYWLICLMGIYTSISSQNEPIKPIKSTTAIAGAQYDKGKFKRWFWGEHYQSTWTTSIHNVPILNLANFDSGLVPYEK